MLHKHIHVNIQKTFIKFNEASHKKHQITIKHFKNILSCFQMVYKNRIHGKDAENTSSVWHQAWLQQVTITEQFQTFLVAWLCPICVSVSLRTNLNEAKHKKQSSNKLSPTFKLFSIA